MVTHVNKRQSLEVVNKRKKLVNRNETGMISDNTGNQSYAIIA